MIDPKVLESFRGKSCLVTGGSGLIGRQVCEILVDAKAEVTSVSMDILPGQDGVRQVWGDLCKYENVEHLVQGQHFVFHLAGIKGSPTVTKNKPASFFVPILQMNTNVLEACRVCNIEKVVYTSSIGAYSIGSSVLEEKNATWGHPMDYFPGWAKRMAELQILAYEAQYGLKNFAVVRPCSVYGPGDNFDPENAMVIPALMAKILRGDNPVQLMTDGWEVRDFLYSRDAAEGIILALHYGTSGSGFINLGSGGGYSIRDLVSAMKQVVPFEVSFTGMSSDFPKRVMDISLAKEKLGFEPSTSLLEGLRQTWGWFVKHSDEHLSKQNYFREEAAI